MEERLKRRFTLTFGLTKDKRIRGGYLKSTDRGIVPCGLCGEEILFVSNYPNILEEITGIIFCKYISHLMVMFLWWDFLKLSVLSVKITILI